MRYFQPLDQVEINAATGVIQFRSDGVEHGPAILALRREGEYVALSASHGPLEIALRPRYDALVRALTRLKPVAGLQTTRQIGTGQTQLDIGLQPDDTLLIRPTIVGDASGHIGFNLALPAAAREQLYRWLEIPSAEQPSTS